MARERTGWVTLETATSTTKWLLVRTSSAEPKKIIQIKAA